MRALLRDTQRLRRFEPAGDVAAWQAAQDRLARLGGSRRRRGPPAPAAPL
ncbi:MAG: hypothetical protein ACM3ML_38690 [Micromonosporaceae bacterium]